MCAIIHEVYDLDNSNVQGQDAGEVRESSDVRIQRAEKGLKKFLENDGKMHMEVRVCDVAALPPPPLYKRVDTDAVISSSNAEWDLLRPRFACSRVAAFCFLLALLAHKQQGFNKYV